MSDHRVDRSMELWRRASALIPGGAQLISRRPSRFAMGVSPAFAVSANGARFIDVDGNEYIDWVSGIGAIILGYADPVVDGAVQNQISSGTIYSINHELEIQLAEALVDAIPCAEMVRYAKGGGEACAVAVRIARGVTGRDKILFCGYHGWHDWYLAANLAPQDPLTDHLFPGIAPTGVPAGLDGTAIPFPYGDASALEQAFLDHPGEVAAVIMEPLRTEMPPDGYLSEVRRLATDNGAVLIFDEVSTGLRLSAGGVQPVVGVVPDLAVLAKSISNGYAMAAVVGSRSVMEPAARMFISSTYWSDTIGLCAALTTLNEVRKRDVPARLHRFGTALQEALNNVAQSTGAPIRCGGLAIHPRLEFDITDESLRQKASLLYIQEMARRGCHGLTSFYLNAAQGDAELEQTATAAREVFSIIERGIRQDTIDDLLDCQPQEELFRRLVH